MQLMNPSKGLCARPHPHAETHSSFSICSPQWMRCHSITSAQLDSSAAINTAPPPHTQTHWDSWVCQSADPRLLGSLRQQCDSHPELCKSVERISLHLHRKRCHRFHFYISLCTYIHSLINPACSNQPCKHALGVRGACWQRGEEFLWWHGCWLIYRLDVLMILAQERKEDRLQIWCTKTIPALNIYFLYFFVFYGWPLK